MDWGRRKRLAEPAAADGKAPDRHDLDPRVSNVPSESYLKISVRKQSAVLPYEMSHLDPQHFSSK